MNETVLKDLIATAIIVVYVALLGLNVVINPALSVLATGAIGFLFKPSANGGWTLTNPFKKVVPIIVALLLLGSTVAKADIFNAIGPKDSKVQLTSLQASGIFNSGTILTDVTQIVNYLGVKEGVAYNFGSRNIINTIGATVITYQPWGVSADLEVLNTDGVALVGAWNIGNYLPVANVPIIKYFTYLYVDAGYGAEQDSNNNWKSAPLIGAEFKFSF